MLHSTEMMLEVILDDEGEKRPLARLCVLRGAGKTRLSYDYHVDSSAGPGSKSPQLKVTKQAF